jgi:hypothetical protein
VGYVKQNKGVSFMFEPDIKEELERGTLKVIPVEEGNIIFFTDLIYDSEKSLSPPAQAFTKMVEELKGEIAIPGILRTH